jgi:hypothetical protein
VEADRGRVLPAGLNFTNEPDRGENAYFLEDWRRIDHREGALTASQPPPGFMQAPMSDHPGVVPLGEPGPEPEPPPRRPLTLTPRTLVAASLAAASAILIVVGTFLPYEKFSAALRNTLILTSETTSWDRVFGNSRGVPTINVFTGFEGHPALYGIPFFVAAAALFLSVAFIIGLRGTPGIAKTTVVASAAATCAMVVMVISDATAYASSEGDGLGVDATTGPALWVFTIGAVVSIAAAGVTLLPERRIPGADTPTPPMGFPMPTPPEQQPFEAEAPEPPQVAVIPESPRPYHKDE